MNNYGQLGWDVPTEKGKAGDGFYHPRLIKSLAGQKITSIEGGEHHTLALTADGQVLSFGRPTYGRLGRKNVDVSSDEPYDVPEVVAGIDGKCKQSTLSYYPPLVSCSYTPSIDKAEFQPMIGYTPSISKRKI
jgi:regulator of chromosome condensation